MANGAILEVSAVGQEAQLDQLTQVQQDGPNDDLLDGQGSFRVLCRELFRRGLWGSWKGWLKRWPA
jgi:hypothetical protein